MEEKLISYIAAIDTAQFETLFSDAESAEFLALKKQIDETFQHIAFIKIQLEQDPIETAKAIVVEALTKRYLEENKPKDIHDKLETIQEGLGGATSYIEASGFEKHFFDQEKLDEKKDTGNNNARDRSEEEFDGEAFLRNFDNMQTEPLLSDVSVPVAESSEAPAEEVDETSPLAARNPQITIRFTPKNNSEMRKAIVAANLTGTLQPRHQKDIETNTERRWYIFETEHKTIKIILDHSNGIMRWVAPDNVTDAQIKTAYTEMLKLRGQLKLDNPKTSSARFSLDQKAVIFSTREEYIAELRRIQDAQQDRMQRVEAPRVEPTVLPQPKSPSLLQSIFGGWFSQKKEEPPKLPVVQTNITNMAGLEFDPFGEQSGETGSSNEGSDSETALLASKKKPGILERLSTAIIGKKKEALPKARSKPTTSSPFDVPLLGPDKEAEASGLIPVESEAPRPRATTATVFYDDNDKKNWKYVSLGEDFYTPNSDKPYTGIPDDLYELHTKEFSFTPSKIKNTVSDLQEAAGKERTNKNKGRPFGEVVSEVLDPTTTVFYHSKTFVPTVIQYRKKYYKPDGTPDENFHIHLTPHTQTFDFFQEPGSDNFAENLSTAAERKMDSVRVEAIARTQADERLKYSPSDDIFHELEEAKIDFLVEDKNTKKLVATDSPSQTVFAEIHFIPQRSVNLSETQIAALQAKLPDSTIQFHRPGVIRLKRTPGTPFSEDLINTTIDTVFKLSHELKIAPTKINPNKKLLSRKLSNSAEARFEARTRGFHRIEVGFNVAPESFEPGNLFTHAGRITKQLEALGFEIHPIARGGGREPTWHLANRDDYDPRSTYELQVVKVRGSDNKYKLVCIAPSHAKLNKLDAAVSASIMLCLNADGILANPPLRISRETAQTSPLNVTQDSFQERRQQILHAQQLGFAIAFERRVPSDLTEHDRREIGGLGFLISEPDKRGNSTFTNNGTVITVTRNAIECIVPRDAADDDIRDALEAMSIAGYSLGHSPKLLLDPDLKQNEKAKLKRIFKAASDEHKPAIEIGYRLKFPSEDGALPLLEQEDYDNGFSVSSEAIRYTGTTLSEEAAIRHMLELSNYIEADPHSLILIADNNDDTRTARLQPHFDRLHPEISRWIEVSDQPGVTLREWLTTNMDVEASIKTLLSDAKNANIDPATIQLSSSPAFTRAEKRNIQAVYDRVHNEAFAPSRAFGTGVTLPLYTNGIDINTFVTNNRADLTRFFAGFGYTLNGLTLTNRANGNVLDIDPANDTIALRHVTGETDDAKLDKIEDALNVMYEFQRVLTPDADPDNDINDILIETTNAHNSPFHGDHSDAIETTVIGDDDNDEDAVATDVLNEVFDDELEHRVLAIPFAGKNNPIAANLAAGLPVPALPVSDDYEIVVHPGAIELIRTTNPLLHSQEMGIIKEGIDEILIICRQLDLQPQTPIINPAPAMNDYRSEIEAYVESGVKALPKWVELSFTGSGTPAAIHNVGVFLTNTFAAYNYVHQAGATPLQNSYFYSDANGNAFAFEVDGNNLRAKYKLNSDAGGVPENKLIRNMLMLAHEAEATRESLNFTPDRNLIPAARDRIQGIYTAQRDLIFPRPFEFAITFERRFAYPHLHADEITALSRLGFVDYSDPEDTRQYGHYRFENRASGIVITLENGDLNCTMPRRPIEDPAVPAAMNNEIDNALQAMFMMGYSLGHNLKLNQNAANPLFDTAANPEKTNLKTRFDLRLDPNPLNALYIPKPRIFIQFTPKADFTPTAAQLANVNARLAPEGISIVYDPNGVSVIRYELNESNAPNAVKRSETDAIKRMVDVSAALTDEPNSLVVSSDPTRQARIEREFNKHRAETLPFAFTFKGQTAADITTLLADDKNRSALEEKAQPWGFEVTQDGQKYFLLNKNTIISLNGVDGKMSCRVLYPPATQEQINEAVKAMMGVAALLHVNPAQLNLDHRLAPEFVDETREHFTKMRDQFFPSKTTVDIRPTDPVLNLYTRLDANLEELNRRLRPLFFKLKKENGLYLLEGKDGETTEGITLGIGDDGAVYLHSIKTQNTVTQENQLNQAIEAATLIFKSFGIPTDTLHTKITGLDEDQTKRLIGDVIPNAIIYFSRHTDDEGHTVTDHVEAVRLEDRWFRNVQPNQLPLSSTIELEEIVLPQAPGAPGLPSAGVLANCLKKTCYLNPNDVGNIDSNVAAALSQPTSFATHSKYSNNGRFIRQCIEERGVRDAINTAQARDPDTGFRIQPDGYHLVNEHSKVKVKRNADGSRQSSFIGGYTKDQVSEVAKELLNSIDAQMREDAVLMERFGAQAFPKEIIYQVTAENRPHTVEEMKIIRAAIEHVRTDFETLKAKYPTLQNKAKLSDKARFVKNTEPVVALSAAKKRKRDDADEPIEPGISGAVRPRGAR